jgi:alpha-N-arabinofuranosidase
MEELIQNHWMIMGETDHLHTVKLVVDEWGAWHETDPSIHPGYLWAYWPTLRDALVSGITLDIFNRHADKVAMANAAQMINNIHSSFIAVGDKFATTPIYEVFDMYAAHQGGTSVRTIFNAGILARGQKMPLPALSGSSSVNASQIVLTATNPDIQNAQEAIINVRGRKIDSAEATVLTASDIHAHNTFEQPNAVRSSTKPVSAGTQLTFQFPPASVTKLVITISA